MNQDAILIANGFVNVHQLDVDLPTANEMDAKHQGWDDPASSMSNAGLATVMGNLAYYGYVPSSDAFMALHHLGSEELTAWWNTVQPILAELTKDNRQIDEFMVYKNFPREVLAMDETEYVMRQSMIYYGFPYEMVAEKAEPRMKLGDMKRLKVLAAADENTPTKIFDNLVSLNNRWSDNQIAWAEKLVGMRNVIDVDSFGFKENGIALAAKFFETREVRMSTATDVLRLTAALSEADVSLRQKVKFRKFTRPERRKLLSIMDGGKNIAEDFATRPEQFKRLLERLRPGDYSFENVSAAYDTLYNKTVKSFAAMIDPQEVVPEILDAAVTRPGEFLRRFHHLYELFGATAVEKFVPVMEKLTTRQLVNFRAYLGTINTRATMIYPPKANWARAQIVPNKKSKIAPNHAEILDARVGELLRERFDAAFPEGVALAPEVAQIKLQTNDQKLAEYGRGTTFDIPEGITFVRSASYWQNDNHCWYDNGWNFFDADWKPVGALSWSAKFHDAAAFSGDPMNSGNTLGKATQIIDLYLDRLQQRGVRYAVWNVLCYSRIKFSDASGEVFALLQWGEDAQKGKVFEPSRCQMSFPLKSDAFASYVAYIDVENRKLVYMDAGLKAHVTNAEANSENLSKVMPAYVEYLDSLPSVHDLLRDVPSGTMPVMFNDEGVTIESPKAFVFRPANLENEYDRVSIADLVGV